MTCPLHYFGRVHFNELNHLKRGRRTVEAPALIAAKSAVFSGLNNALIAPPQPSFSLFSQQLAADALPPSAPASLADCAKNVLTPAGTRSRISIPARKLSG